MTPTEALRQAALAGKLDQFDVSGHALTRMRQRNVTRRDVRLALQSATAAAQEDGARWKLTGGHDDDGEPLALVVAFVGRTLVVTVF